MLLEKFKWLTHGQGGWSVWEEKPDFDEKCEAWTAHSYLDHCFGRGHRTYNTGLLSVPCDDDFEYSDCIWKREGEKWLHVGTDNG